jgi:hypothetical protein
VEVEVVLFREIRLDWVKTAEAMEHPPLVHLLMLELLILVEVAVVKAEHLEYFHLDQEETVVLA